MKYILKRNEKGQNTVEYLMMLAVVVGVVLVVGAGIKSKLPGVWNQILGSITGAANDLSK